MTKRQKAIVCRLTSKPDYMTKQRFIDNTAKLWQALVREADNGDIEIFDRETGERLERFNGAEIDDWIAYHNELELLRVKELKDSRARKRNRQASLS